MCKVHNVGLRYIKNYSRSGRVLLVTSRLGTEKTITFFYSVVQREMLRNQPLGTDIYDPSGFIMSPRETVSGFLLLECFFERSYANFKGLLEFEGLRMTRPKYS
jgi:hypothetical protein